jgi:hypothetical protein
LARFCFVSFAQPGHCDFGGMSYVRTAQELMRRGHRVRWVLSHHWRGYRYARVCSLLEGFGIPVEDLGPLYLTIDHRKEDMRPNARNFARYITSEKYDCVVLDRLCIGAAFATHAAGIPWAVVGTDGREWSHQKRRFMLNSAVLPGPYAYSHIDKVANDLCTDDFPKPSTSSYWATSPFLNISFFPKAYYHDEHHAALPDHAHFLGSGPAREPLLERKQLLVTFGNSFDPILRRQLVSILLPFIRNRSIPTLMLTGEEDLAKSLRGVYKGLSHVAVEAWVPYDEAYRDAHVAVGHGGTSHIWYGMREGTPILAVPFVGDQLYGGLQLERLNVGRAVLPLAVPGLSSRVLRKLGKIDIRLSKSELLNKLYNVLTDEEVLESSLRLSHVMRTGGGVEASALLLERLAQEQACISTCVEPFCCC